MTEHDDDPSTQQSLTKICRIILVVTIMLQIHIVAIMILDGTDFLKGVSGLQKTRKRQKTLTWRMEGIAPGAHMDLLPWEVSSHETQECAPPNGIPSYCCIGSYSAGGGNSFRQNSPCANRSILDDYGQAKKSATKFLEQHPVEGNECDVCQIVNLLIHSNWTLAFQGDSLSRQTFSGLECELRRRGYMVEAVSGENKERNKTAFWKYGLTYIENLKVTWPNETMGRHAKVAYYQMYRPYGDNNETQNIARVSDILVFDHGLHWGIPSQSIEFKNAMAGLLRGYSRNETKGDKLKLLAWRETSAQHFDSPTGEYSPGTQWEIECIPRREILRDQPLRTQLMTEAAEMAGFAISNASDSSFLSKPVSRADELVILPYYRFTSELHRVHPGECTHFCHTPYVWIPIWRTLRLALDRAILNKDW
jgi:hypothetical protein